MDYCTLFPEGWWAQCCMAHDAAYDGQIGQALADDLLWQCVAASAPDGTLLGLASVGIASVMWLGVRLFGRRNYRKAGGQKP